MSDSTADKALWAFDQCKSYPIPGHRVLVRNPRNGRHAVLTPDVLVALNLCQEFQTLEQHAHTIANTLPGLEGQDAEIVQVLKSVRDDGLLLNANIYSMQLQPSAQARIQTDKPVVCVLTWERPEALSRCLESLRQNSDLNNVAAVHVIDDSRSATVQNQNRQSTEHLAEYTQVPVQYMGAAEQQAFMEQLIAKVPALEPSVRFLIDRQRWAPYWTSGLARTVALLLSAGRRLLVLDDDILCEAYNPPARERAASFANNHRQARFYQNNDQWSDYKASAGTDPLLRHLSCLGSGLADALSALGITQLDGNSSAGAQLAFMESLQADSPVLVTECGAFGDPGTARIDWLTGLDKHSLEELFSNTGAVEHALAQRNCWIGRDRVQVQPYANMSQLTGLDNRTLLPPYIPIMRGEDRLFGHMVRFLHPHSVCVDQAWAVPHLPIPEREWGGDNQRFNIDHPFPEFSMSLVADHMDLCPATDPLHRMEYLGRIYQDLARTGHETLVESYLDYQTRQRAENYQHLRNVSDATSQAPQAWQQFLDDGLSRLDQALVDAPIEPRVTGYPEGLSNRELTRWWNGFWEEFSQALRAWPAIRLAARQLVEGKSSH